MSTEKMKWINLSAEAISRGILVFLFAKDRENLKSVSFIVAAIYRMFI